MPPDSFAEWEGLVASVAEHLVGRYGLDAVSEWHFEVWNELWGVPFPEPYMRLCVTDCCVVEGSTPCRVRDWRTPLQVPARQPPPGVLTPLFGILTSRPPR